MAFFNLLLTLSKLFGQRCFLSHTKKTLITNHGKKKRDLIKTRYLIIGFPCVILSKVL